MRLDTAVCETLNVSTTEVSDPVGPKNWSDTTLFPCRAQRTPISPSSEVRLTANA